MKDDLWQEMGLTEQEYMQIKDFLQREPNELELGILGVLQDPGEHIGGAVDIGDEQAVVLRMKATSGVGESIRGILTTGAQPVALLNSLYFGSLKSKQTRTAFAKVVAEIAAYGNNVQLPTVAGQTYFHPSYEENCLVNVLCVGLLKQQELSRAKASEPGNPLMLIGACTGREETGGASDPNLGKILIDVCLELTKIGAVLGMQDLGAAGLIGSCCELAIRAGTGLEIDVTEVPLSEAGLNLSEIIFSQTQERMLLVASQGKEPEVLEFCNRRGITAAVIGRVTADGFMTVKEGVCTVAHLPVRALTEFCPNHERQATEPEGLAQAQSYYLAALPEMEDYSKVLLTLLGTPTIASKEWVYNQYDHLLDIDTMVPRGGDAAVLRVVGFNKGIALTVDGNSRYVYLDPYRGGQIAAAEAARNLVCVGAEPLAVTACFNFGNPNNPEDFWRLKESVSGISDACRELETPVMDQKVSFDHETAGEAIYPTPVVGMAGLIKDLMHVTTSAFKQADDLIILLGQNKDEIGASTYLSVIHGLEAGRAPELNLELEKQVQKAALALIQSGLAVSAHDCAEGGLAVALAECCIAGRIGAEVALMENLRPSSILFGETQSRIIITIPKDKLDAVLQQLNNWQVPFKVLGNVGGDMLSITGSGWKVNLGLQEIEEKYRGAIECMMKS